MPLHRPSSHQDKLQNLSVTEYCTFGSMAITTSATVKTLSIAGNATIHGNLAVKGNFTFGDATTDELTTIGAFKPQANVMLNRASYASASISQMNTTRTFVSLATTTHAAVFCTLASTLIADGKILIILDEDGNAGSNPIEVRPHLWHKTIDGGSLATISTGYGVLRLISDGTNWFTW